jgi:toxin ParE1/3/4
VKVSARAREDIERALHYTLSEFGPRKHDEYVELIARALRELAADPKHHRSTPRPDLHPDARTLHIGRRGKKARHLFVYRVNVSGDVEIARFLHDAMDVPRHLDDDK